jgi:hypothetical protein
MNWTEEKEYRAKRIKEIAALFPGAVIERDGDGNADGFRLNGDERIHIGYNSWGAKGHRLHISGCWPRSKIPSDSAQFTHRDVDYKSESPSITADANKSAEQIKRDIERRFLPAYRALLAKCLEARDRHDQYTTSRNQNAEEIARLCGGRVYGQAPNRFLVDLPGTIQGDLELCDQSASIKLRSLSLERARELAALIAKWYAGDKAGKEVAS